MENCLVYINSSAVYSLLVTGERFVATGDDDGVLKVWYQFITLKGWKY